MKYYRRIDEGYHAPGEEWGDPTYWVEVNERGDSERQIEIYPNARVHSYDRTHDQDEHGGRGIMVVDGNEEWWRPYEITREKFEAQWRAHSPLNRGREEPRTAG